jgi:pyruvate/2-oxoglutarate/acetoin dehydrogenase E1 component
VDTYQKAAKLSREEHVPCIVHVIEVTQPQGHSTSGSHERYKTKDRLAWEHEYDCNVQMRKWILAEEICEESELESIEKQAAVTAKEAKNNAWKAFVSDIKEEVSEVVEILSSIAEHSAHRAELSTIKDSLAQTVNPIRMDVVRAARKVLRIVRGEDGNGKESLKSWLQKSDASNWDRYSNFLYSEYEGAAIKVETIPAKFNKESAQVDGREVLQACFDAALSRDPKVFAFGEDVGKIGDVNQAFAGLQDKYGDLKVTDTGIRECTIIGQAIGASLRGLRPIVEIQYLDYMLYALQTLADDVACLQYRTKGGQKAPLIVRTRGHRLEGVWHSGSPMGMILNSLRGMYVLVPRNMTQAAGFYNTMLQSDDPALIIECLNGYRLKESIPENIGEFTVPLGKPEILRSGDDVTIVTYGSMCRIVMDAVDQLNREGISCEVIDVQTLLPFDIDQTIVESLKKTNRIVFADEDVPGGATAFMMQKVLEEQNGYRYLDSKPLTISAQEHRPAYSSDGDYFSKPSVDDVFDKIYELISEANPDDFPEIY